MAPVTLTLGAFLFVATPYYSIRCATQLLHGADCHMLLFMQALMQGLGGVQDDGYLAGNVACHCTEAHAKA